MSSAPAVGEVMVGAPIHLLAELNRPRLVGLLLGVLLAGAEHALLADRPHAHGGVVARRNREAETDRLEPTSARDCAQLRLRRWVPAGYPLDPRLAQPMSRLGIAGSRRMAFAQVTNTKA